MCNTTAEMVAKNQHHNNSSVQSELEKPVKAKKTSIAKRAAKLKKEKRSTLASNITQDLNTVLGDLSQLSKPIASSSIASYSKKSEAPLLPKTPALKNKHLNVIDETASIHASGKVKQIIQMCEARAKTPATLVASTKKAQTGTATGAQSSRVVRNLNLQYGGTKTLGSTAVAKNLVQDNPIDKRKERLSARVEAKRQSMAKQVNALLKDSLDCLDSRTTNPEVRSEVKHEPLIPGNLDFSLTILQCLSCLYEHFI